MGELYIFTNGWSMAREVPHPFYWILRNEDGERLDRDKYRNDIICRHRLKVKQHIEPETVS